MSIFKSYDIRGIYGQDWNRDIVSRIGSCLPSLLEAEEILIGRDVRQSSDEIFTTLSQGIMEAGCNVCDIGLCTTPSLYFATAFYGFDGSVMITASHNPPPYNGLKISGKSAVPIGYATGLNKLEEMTLSAGSPSREEPKKRQGILRTLNILRDYLTHLEPFKTNIGNLKAVIDCSDGMAGIFLHDVMHNLPAEIIAMYDIPDGNFPHHEPNPLDESNLEDLKKRTLSEGADLGICFDGDGDRVMFIDERGAFISPDLITALLGIYFFNPAPGSRGKNVVKETGKPTNAVTYDVRTSRSVVEFIEKLGGKPIICPVGHSHAKKLLRETNGIFGGELAGHYYFRDNYFCDSAMMAALIVLSILSREKKPISELIARIRKYSSSGEINFLVKDKDKIIERILKDYGEGKLETIDGIRIDFPDWWFNLRKSNTEPYLRLVVEADTQPKLARRERELREKIAALDNENYLRKTIDEF